MALPSSYLTSTKNVSTILEAMKNAQAPDRVTQRFLEDLGFASNADRLLINVLKALGLLSDTGSPLPAYHRFLDRTESKRVLAEGVRHAYADLFQLNRSAQTMSKVEVQGKMKTLSQGQYSDDVLSKMANTFKTLAGLADFSTDSTERETPAEVVREEMPDETPAPEPGLRLNGLVYNINLHLPESRDPAVYDALFRSLKEHLQ